MRSSLLGILAGFAIACGGTTLPTGAAVTDGGTTSEGGTTSPATCKASCLGGELDWEPNGGLTSATTSSRVSSCTTYVYEESSDQSGDLSCTDELSDACGATLGAGDIYAAMQSSDVTNAFAHADGNTVLGADGRPCDGAVLQVTYQGKSILIGSDCGSGCIQGASCTPVPAGVRALATTLQKIDEQELQTPACKGVFP